MKYNNSYSWQTLAHDFLGDTRMLDTYCTKEAQCLMMALGSKISSVPGFIYFLANREELIALSRFQTEHYCYLSSDKISNWLRGFSILASWRMGYHSIEDNDLLARLFSYDDYERIAKFNFEREVGNRYHIHQLKKEQQEALQSQDIARLRLYVDLAPEPERKLRQLLSLAVKEGFNKVAAELLNWILEYPAACDDRILLHFLKLIKLPSESEEEFLEKLQKLEEYPLLKILLENKTFQKNWFQWLMQNGLLNFSIMKKMLRMGMPTDIVINDNSYLKGEYNHLENLFKYRHCDISVLKAMRLFQEMKPYVLPILHKHSLCHGNYRLISLYCELSDAFAEWENEKS